MTSPQTLQSAITYTDRGWSIVPFHTDKKRPWLSSWTEYQKSRLSCADLVALWNERPGANVGAITGKISDLTVMDLDGVHSPGLLKAAGVCLPRTLVHKTPHGWHCLFRYIPSLRTDAAVLVAGDECDCIHNGQPKKCQIDVRNDGGCIVLPPSTYSGVVYKILRDVEPAEWQDVPQILKARSSRGTVIRSSGSGPAPKWLPLVFDSLVNWLNESGKRPRQSGEGVMALCPFHDDREPSLSLHAERGWKCFAGCGQGRLTRLANLLGVQA